VKVKKYVAYPQEESEQKRKTKNSYEIYPMKLGGSTQNRKKIIETPETREIKHFSKKVYLVPQKWKEAKNSYGGYLTEFPGLTQNRKKIIGTSNQLIRMKIFQKKSKFITLKVKWSQKSFREYLTEFAQGSLKTIWVKLSSKNLNLDALYKLFWQTAKVDRRSFFFYQ
jgi:hypothetical protein